MAPRPILHGSKMAALAAAILLLLLRPYPLIAEHGSKPHETNNEVTQNARAILWQAPMDIASRDLYSGPGGREHAPHSTYTFEKEDLNGTNPKFDVRDEHDVKWKVKLGVEARPEVVASRLVWAVGYFTDEDYFVPELLVQDMPPLKRGQNLVSADGTVHNVRLKRYEKDEKKIGNWKWGDNPFERQRQLYGLRVMMALMNNWDVKDSNNAIYEEKNKDGGQPQLHYEVSDLGASFGATGLGLAQSRCKGNLNSYKHSRFIRKITPESVDFTVPTRAEFIYAFIRPGEFKRRLDLRWLGKEVPRADARWIGGLLAQLSPEQIRDAFRAAGYSPEQVEGFSRVVEGRIAELNTL